ncbi:MAG: (d)CMP kinase [Actinobacteria bacterium]|nr:(d)CMP kinase [Actinomycetota bacterium]
MPTPLVIAIDGPSGSGKSSTARGVARKLGLSYLDTGSMYRAVTWHMLANNIDVRDAQAVASEALNVEIRVGTDPLAPEIWVGATDVSGPIRGEEVTSAVSSISAVPQVRAQLVQIQQEVTQTCTNGVVVEGRDIGTVVLPNATLKVYLTADHHARATRRAAENGDDASTIAQSLQARDNADTTRAVSPLEKAADAVEVDTTHMTLDEAIQHICDLAVSRNG